MRSREKISVLWLFALLAGGVPFARAVPVEPPRCSGSSATVAASNSAEFSQICTAVQDAATFLPTVGLQLPEELSIVTTDKWPTVSQAHAFAQYDCRTHIIRILPFALATKATTTPTAAFGVPLTPALWRSYLAHEIAHAAAHRQLRCELRALATTEYIAAVVQLGSMPAAERDNILGNYRQLAGFDRTEEITEIYYALAPDQFAVNAWLHFLKPGNGPQFITTLLAAGTPPADTPPEPK